GDRTRGDEGSVIGCVKERQGRTRRGSFKSSSPAKAFGDGQRTKGGSQSRPGKGVSPPAKRLKLARLTSRMRRGITPSLRFQGACCAGKLCLSGAAKFGKPQAHQSLN